MKATKIFPGCHRMLMPGTSDHLLIVRLEPRLELLDLLRLSLMMSSAIALISGSTSFCCSKTWAIAMALW
jgi:hypothetical protein